HPLNGACASKGYVRSAWKISSREPACTNREVKPEVCSARAVRSHSVPRWAPNVLASCACSSDDTGSDMASILPEVRCNKVSSRADNRARAGFQSYRDFYRIWLPLQPERGTERPQKVVV